MNFLSMGDLTNTMLLRRHNIRLREQMGQLAAELTTGETSDIVGRFKGNYAHIGEIERDLKSISALDLSLAEAKTSTAAIQTVLEETRKGAVQLAEQLVNAELMPSTALLHTQTASADAVFRAALGNLNQTVGGQSLFAGARTDGTALADADTILNALRIEIAGETTVAGFRSAIHNWFTQPGGFDTVGYTGSLTDSPQINLRNGVSVSHGLRADNMTIRETLAELATATLVSDVTSDLSDEVRPQILRDSGVRLLTLQVPLTALQTSIGGIEERIENNLIENATERASLEMTYNMLMNVDQFETATRLEEARHQLENLYTITVRLSRLSLSEYL